MSLTATALIGLVLWSVVLTFVLLFTRMAAVGRGERELNTFQADGRDLGAAGLRVTRAHANSLEYLAGSAALMLLAIATGQTAITDGLAMVVLGCRVGQSVVHIISTAKPMVLLRATLFTVQIVIWIIWSVRLLQV
jgi:uncharacterized MAPEG superfamily protein